MTPTTKLATRFIAPPRILAAQEYDQNNNCKSEKVRLVGKVILDLAVILLDAISFGTAAKATQAAVRVTEEEAARVADAIIVNEADEVPEGIEMVYTGANSAAPATEAAETVLRGASFAEKFQVVISLIREFKGAGLLGQIADVVMGSFSHLKWLQYTKFTVVALAVIASVVSGNAWVVAGALAVIVAVDIEQLLEDLIFGIREIKACQAQGTADTFCDKPVNFISPSGSNFGECEGDCDSDADCAPGLVCPLISVGDNAPGCVGESPSGSWDFCARPECIDDPATLEPDCHTGSPGDEDYCSSDCPCEEGEGDCDADAQCAGALVCAELDGVGRCTSIVNGLDLDLCDSLADDPSYTDAQGDSCADWSGRDCYRAAEDFGYTQAQEIELVKNCPRTCEFCFAEECTLVATSHSLGTPSTSSGTYGLCEGDCDSDADCDPGLVCHQRVASSDPPAPGCAGEPVAAWDYCVSPKWTTFCDCSVNVDFQAARPPAGETFGLCEGDCDSDAQCDPGLVCYQRGYDDPVGPGCKGEPYLNFDYCVDPVCSNECRSPITSISANAPATHYGLCEGDCDSDDECAPGLVCDQRVGNDPPPPGCTGEALPHWDYCVDPSWTMQCN